MATRRMVASDIFEDDFFMALDLLGQSLWIGLIVRCADDQGRLQDNSILIKSQVYPSKDFKPEEIEIFLDIFAKAGKILRYEANGKHLIQILSWWKHQTPQWASPSRYPAPTGWTDREKYHAPGNKIVTNNWATPGGFLVASVVSNPVSNPPDNHGSTPATKPIEEGDVKGEGEGDGDGKAEAERKQNPAAAAAGLKNQIDQDIGELSKAYEQNIGILTPMIRDTLLDDLREYGLIYCRDSIFEAVQSNARNWKYCQAILKRWKKEGRNGKVKQNGREAQIRDQFEKFFDHSGESEPVEELPT